MTTTNRATTKHEADEAFWRSRSETDHGDFGKSHNRGIMLAMDV